MVSQLLLGPTSDAWASKWPCASPILVSSCPAASPSVELSPCHFSRPLQRAGLHCVAALGALACCKHKSSTSATVAAAHAPFWLRRQYAQPQRLHWSTGCYSRGWLPLLAVSSCIPATPVPGKRSLLPWLQWCHGSPALEPCLSYRQFWRSTGSSGAYCG